MIALALPSDSSSPTSRRRRGPARGAIDNSLDAARFGGQPVGALELAGEIVRLLITMDVRVGERIASERMLSERLGMPRSAVREALKALALLGVVDVRRGSGTYLARPDSDVLPQVVEWGLLLNDNNLFDILDLRLFLEPQIASQAAVVRTDEDLADLQELLRRMESAAELEDRLLADIDFHRRLAAVPRNRALLTVTATTLNLMWAWVRRLSALSEQLGAPYTPLVEHKAVLEAIAARQPDEARAAMLAHLTRTAAGIKQVAAHDPRVSPPDA